MRKDSIFNREYVNQLKELEEAIDIVKSPAVQEAMCIAENPFVLQAYQNVEPVKLMSDQLSILYEFARNSIEVLSPDHMLYQYLQIPNVVTEAINPLMQLYSYEQVEASVRYIEGILANYNLMYYYPDNMSDEEIDENEEINSKIVTEIFKSDAKIGESTSKKESAIITLSPVNERVLRYLAENPESFYHLEDREFELVMAEIYSKLGYKVELTKATRDGGKDIIIRKPEILGDFVYYVECKKYAAKRPVGVGIIKGLVGTISADRVNGGILATTSYFTPDARRFIIDHKYDCQIKMHDYDKIRKMLDSVV